jgi:hypothetical protein
MKPYTPAALMFATLLSACATTPPASVQIASCREMEGDMGLATPHDHAEMKGQGHNPMNLSHDRCLQILKQSRSSATGRSKISYPAWPRKQGEFR